MLRRSLILEGAKDTINQTIASIQAKGAGSVKYLSFSRPSFSYEKQKAARLEATLATDRDYMKANLSVSELDLAAPHRLPYAWFRDKLLDGNPSQIKRIVDELCGASKIYENALENKGGDFKELARFYRSTRENVQRAYSEYRSSISDTKDQRIISLLKLIEGVNNLASNAPGLGPHSTTNAIVSDRLHVHPVRKRSLSPRSKAALAAGKGQKVATSLTNGKRSIVSVTGALHPMQQDINYDDVNLGTRVVVRGALFIDGTGKVWKPKNPTVQPTGFFSQDWEQVL